MKKAMFWGYLFTIVSACLYGCMALITKNLYAQGVNAITAVLLRNLLSVPVMGVLALWREKQLKVPAKALLSIGGVGLMGSVLTPLLLFAAYNYIPSGADGGGGDSVPAAAGKGGHTCQCCGVYGRHCPVL